MANEFHPARLEQKRCLSAASQCYHFEFQIDGLEHFPYAAGQFVSMVAEDAYGKQQTRAYSLASASNANRFELCVNRVVGGFFSNHLADLPIGSTIPVRGPHGYFTLRAPLVDSILIASGAGIAPIRAILQEVFPESGPDSSAERSPGKQFWLLFGASQESDLYYHEDFEALAGRWPNFHYLPILSHAPESWNGLHGSIADHAARIFEERATRTGLPPSALNPGLTAVELQFGLHAYVCGLNSMVAAVRSRLADCGCHRRQIVFERYD